MPKAKIIRHIAAPLILRIVEQTAARYDVPWSRIMSPKRDAPTVAEARVMAMAICRAAGVPTHTVARAFGRTWQTVDSARAITIQRCTECADTRDEFIAILTQSLKP